jgi:hypothetical protein
MGYSDGVNRFPDIVLPPDLIKPLRLAERPSSGSTPNASAFIDMDGPEQGITSIPSIPKDEHNRIWTWASDQIYLPGAIVPTELQVEYESSSEPGK